MFCNKPGGKNAQRCQEHNNKRNGNIHTEHENERSQNGQHTSEKLCKTHQHPISKSFHICNHTAYKVSGGMRIQVGKRKCLEFADGCITKVTRNAVGYPVIADSLRPLGEKRNKRSNSNQDSAPAYAREIYFSRTQHKVDGIACQNWNIEPRCGTDGSTQHTENHKQAIGCNAAKHTPQRCTAFLAAQFFLRQTHQHSPPFLN